MTLPLFSNKPFAIPNHLFLNNATSLIIVSKSITSSSPSTYFSIRLLKAGHNLLNIFGRSVYVLFYVIECLNDLVLLLSLVTIKSFQIIPDAVIFSTIPFTLHSSLLLVIHFQISDRLNLQCYCTLLYHRLNTYPHNLLLRRVRNRRPQ